MSTMPLSWSDHFFLRFRVLAATPFCKGGGLIKMVPSQRLMDYNLFLGVLGDFPAGITGTPVEALVALWNGEVTRAVNTIAPKCPLLQSRARAAPWYTPELRVKQQAGRQLKHAGEAVTVLNRCFDAVMDWMKVNKLRLNPDKTEVLLVGCSSAWVNDVQPVLDGVALPLKDQVHSLGVPRDPALSLEAQVASVARSAFYQFRLIRQL
ncbi:uncharacterized protein LOC128346445 [Hemicordylus capensis]|uniref:uncharacterized protein LOC128346445 n=1 Tax=Hemicordylus capensis TaxID=884348 RepID=UPI0023041D5D|nr:uncharacterized protein LOC128346445 [Hemicordylus capensis]